MVNRIRKGNRSLLKAKKFAEECGFEVGKVEFRAKYKKNKDLFGLFDQIWIRENTVKPLFVQVKTNKKPSSKELEKYLDFAKKYKQFCLYLVFFDRKKEPMIFFIYPKGIHKLSKTEFIYLVSELEYDKAKSRLKEQVGSGIIIGA